MSVITEVTVVNVVANTSQLLPVAAALALVIANPLTHRLEPPFGTGAYTAEGLLEAFRVSTSNPTATYAQLLGSLVIDPIGVARLAAANVFTARPQTVPGLITPGVTGGDKGPNTINVGTLYEQGKIVAQIPHTPLDWTIQRTLEQIGGAEVIDMVGQGADPSGVATNCEVAFAQAMAIANTRTRAVIFYRPGLYKESAAGSYGVHSQLVILGAGQEATRVTNSYSGGTRKTFGDNAGAQSIDVRIHGIDFGGGAHTAGSYFDFRNIKSAALDHCRIFNCRQCIVFGGGATGAANVQQAWFRNMELGTNGNGAGVGMVDLFSVGSFVSEGFLYFITSSGAYGLVNTGTQNCDGVDIEHMAANDVARAISIVGGGCVNFRVTSYNFRNFDTAFHFAPINPSRHIIFGSGVLVSEATGLGPGGAANIGFNLANTAVSMFEISGLSAENIGGNVVLIAAGVEQATVDKVRALNCGRVAGSSIIKTAQGSGSVSNIHARRTAGTAFTNAVEWVGASPGAGFREGPSAAGTALCTAIGGTGPNAGLWVGTI